MAGRPLAARARLSMTAVAAVSVLAAAVVFLGAFAAWNVDVRGDELERQARAFAAGLDENPDLAVGGLRERLFRVEARLIGATVAVTDARGMVLYSTAEAPPDSYPLERLGTLDADGVGRGVRALPRSGQAVYVLIRLADGRHLITVQPIRDIRSASAGILGLTALSAAIALIAAWIAGGWLARRLTGPVVRLRDAAEAVAEGEWGRTVLVEGDGEVASLARSFNRMSARVSAAYTAQQEFVGDVSHELKTPITSIQGFAEALTDGTVTDPETSRRYLRIIRDESGRLGDLTRVLLSLADLDAGVVEFDGGPVDTEALADALRARFEPQAAERSVLFEVGALDAAVPLGDFARLLQAASAVVDNALEYTPPGGEVLVSARAEQGCWILTVDDSGPGIPPGDREAVFERFTRLDRSRSTTGGGSGLGLSLSRGLMRLMDGDVRAEDSPLGGARIVLELPAQAQH